MCARAVWDGEANGLAVPDNACVRLRAESSENEESGDPA